MSEKRDPNGITHTLVDMIRSRMFAICCGYEDCSDLDEPVFLLLQYDQKLACMAWKEIHLHTYCFELVTKQISKKNILALDFLPAKKTELLTLKKPYITQRLVDKS